MSLAVARDLDLIVRGAAQWWRDARGATSVDVLECTRPSDGLSSETVLLRAGVTVSGHPRDESVVLRLPPVGEGIFPDYRLDVQAAVQNHVREHGIPAAPAEFVADERYFGVPFMVMPRVAGHVPAMTPQTDPWINDQSPGERAGTYDGYLATVAAIHAVPAGALASVLPARDVDADLDYWRAYLDWYADGEHPVARLDDALAFCARHRPPDPPATALLWGDVRLGNVIFGPDRAPVAVLDWEMATIGAPEHDLGWLFVLEWVQDLMLGGRVDGFADRAVARARYEELVGRPLEHLEWFELFALLRSAAIMTRIAVLHERADVPGLFPVDDNPVLDLLLRRVDEYGAGS